jgi:hypothetical protein
VNVAAAALFVVAVNLMVVAVYVRMVVAVFVLGRCSRENDPSRQCDVSVS